MCDYISTFLEKKNQQQQQQKLHCSFVNLLSVRTEASTILWSLTFSAINIQLKIGLVFIWGSKTIGMRTYKEQVKIRLKTQNTQTYALLRNINFMYDRPNLFVLVSPVYRSCFFQRAPQVSNNYLNNRELTGQGSIYDYQIVQCLLAGIVAYIAGDTWTHSLWKHSVLNSFKKK